LLGEHLSEKVSIFDGLGHRRGFVVLESRRVAASAIARLGNDPDDVARPWTSRAMKDDCGAGAAALKSGQEEVQKVCVAANRWQNFHKAVDQCLGRSGPRAAVGPSTQSRL
jgi:hypothetical protein